MGTQPVFECGVDATLPTVPPARNALMTSGDKRIVVDNLMGVFCGPRGAGHGVRSPVYPLNGRPDPKRAKFPGTYNARRDNLEGFWKDLFGFTHGIAVVNAFYENVNRHRVEGRKLGAGEAVENVVLEFKPRPTQDLLVACLWSRWSGTGEPDILSFAAIKDDPPAEVSAAGHDRCIIPIQPEHVEAWLNPDPQNLAAQYGPRGQVSRLPVKRET